MLAARSKLIYGKSLPVSIACAHEHEAAKIWDWQHLQDPWAARRIQLALRSDGWCFWDLPALSRWHDGLAAVQGGEVDRPLNWLMRRWKQVNQTVVCPFTSQLLTPWMTSAKAEVACRMAQCKP